MVFVVMRWKSHAAISRSTPPLNGYESTTTALYVEVGSRDPVDMTTCSDIDMMSSSTNGMFRHKDGRPY